MPTPSTRPGELSKRLLHFSLIFCSVFIAYGTSEILQSSLYSSGGYVCLLVVYVAFLLSSLTAPLLVHKIGPLPTLWRCAIFYALIVLVSSFGSGVPNWLRLTTCASVGLAGGGFWNAQAAYVSRLSQEYATATGVSLSSALSRFTSVFFIVFSSAQVLSQLLSSAILSGFGPKDIGVAVTALFSILFIFSTCGTIALSFLAPPEDPGSCVFRVALPCCGVRSPSATPPLSNVSVDTITPKEGVETATIEEGGEVNEKRDELEEAAKEKRNELEEAAKVVTVESATSLPPPTPTQVLLFLLSQPPLLATLPICFYGGGSLGFVLGPFLGSFSSVKVGVSNVGFVSAVYNFTNILCAYPLDSLCRTPAVGRRWVFAGAIAAHALWLIVAAALLTGYGGLVVSSASGNGSGSGSSGDYALVFGVIILFGTAAPVFQSQLPALLQTWYPSPRDSSCAIAVYRVMFSLGFIAAQGISLGYAASGCGGSVGDPCLGQQSTIWACILGISGVGLAWLHFWGGKQVE